MGMIINPFRFGTAGRPGGDPNWANVVFLSGFEGANGSQSLVDESASAKTITVTGTTAQAAISTASAKFGASSLLRQTPGLVTCADSADWHFSNGDFTVELFVNFTSVPTGVVYLVSQWTASSQQSWALQFSGAPNSKPRFLTSTTGSNFNTRVEGAASSWAPSAGTWYHVAVDRSGTTFRIYVDGVMLASSTSSETLFNSTGTMNIGSQSTSGTNAFPGYVDEVRITKGVARYASNSGYTVPTTAFPSA